MTSKNGAGKEPLTASEIRKSNLKRFAIVTTIVLAVFGCGAMLSNDESGDGGGSRKTDGYDAQVACKDAVKDRLKAPATAKFSNVDHTSAGAEAWTVTGDVDSENSFGANIRTSWKCEIRIDGSQWRYSITTS